jgi:hypothetical protein
MRISRIVIASLSIIAIGGLVAMPADAAGTTAQGPWSFAESSDDLGVIGADSFAYPLGNGTDRVFAVSSAFLPAPVSAFDCPASGPCQRVALNSRFGSSTTMVTLPDGTRRAYFVDMNNGMKTIKTAVVNPDGVSHGTVVSTGIAVPMTTLAWGVPDAFIGPDGKVHLIWVEENLGAASTGSTSAPCAPVKPTAGIVTPPVGETLVSATATDASGTTFSRDPGYRMTGGYVDPEILRANSGDWVMIMSTGPGCATQRLYTATSKDGAAWTLNPTPLTPANVSSLDPTGFETTPNTWRIYYTTSAVSVSLGPSDSGYILHRGTLTFNPSQVIVKGGKCTQKNATFGSLKCVKKAKKGNAYVWR